MSLNPIPTPVIKVFDPRIDALKERQYVITKSANKVSYIPYKSQSTGSTAMSFNVIPPSRNTFVDRKMFIQTTVRINFSAPWVAMKDGDTIVAGTKDAPRSFPLARALASANATIGNTNVSMQTSDVIDCLLRCMKNEDLKDYNNGCPTALDRSQTYECYIANNGLNVLGNATQSPLLADGEYSRGYFNVTIGAQSVSAGGIATQEVSFQVFEPVMLSPFVFSKMNHCSLIGLQSIQLLYNFSNNLELVWSGTQLTNAANAPVPVTATVNFAPSGSSISDAQLWVAYYSPSPLMEIPKAIDYNFSEVQRFLSNGFQNLNYGDVTTCTSSNVQLKVIPSLIIAGVRRTKASQRYYNPDCYYSIKKASINFANSVGLLSTASPYNLWSISKKNGLAYDFSQWVGQYGSLNQGNSSGANIPTGCGSLLVIKPSEDLGLSDSEASGLSGAFNLQIGLDVQCIDPSISAPQSDYELFIILVNEGTVAIDVAGTGSVSSTIGCVSEADILKAETKPWLDYNDLKGLVGGDFISSLKNFVKSVPSVAHKVAEYAPHVSNGLKSLGLGMGAGVSAGELIGSGKGGKLLGRSTLKDRLK